MSLKLYKPNRPRLMALLLACLLVLSSAPAALAAESGICGNDLTWSLEGGTLTISGTGPMDDYAQGNMAPWYSLRGQILQVSLPDGLTRIGSRAFYDCYNLKAITVPGSVEYIGNAAFCQNLSMTMVALNEGLRNIADSAFELCGIQDLRVPSTVSIIGSHAFYACENLIYVSLPGNVYSYGSGIFTNCTNLMRVDVAATQNTLPSWTFYGCDKLTSVNLQEVEISASGMKIPSNTGTTQPQPPVVQENTTQPSTGTITQTTTTPSGETSTTTTTVKKTEDSTTVSNTTKDTDTSEVKTEITATVVSPDGWKDVIQQVENAELTQKTQGGTGSVDVTVYLPEDDRVSKDVIQELTGRDVMLNVQTQSGSQFTLDCEKLGQQKFDRDLDLSYSLELAEDVPEMLAGCTVYKLSFHNSASILAEIIIRLPGGHSRETASLYQIEKDGLNLLQSVMVDDDGNAHWYLKSVDHKTEYLIGMNVPGANASEAIIPEVLYDEYKLANVYDGVEYVVTGRSSSWGVGLGQVMGILAAVMVGMIVLVGFVMYAMNKRRLKMGYVPELDEEDYL